MTRKDFAFFAVTFILFLVVDATHVFDAIPGWPIYALFLAFIMFRIVKHYWFDTKEMKSGKK